MDFTLSKEHLLLQTNGTESSLENEIKPVMHRKWMKTEEFPREIWRKAWTCIRPFRYSVS